MSHESTQPNLTDLLARYLQKQAEAQASGITTFDGEVTPYEVGPVQPLDAKLAWDEAVAVLGYYGSASGQPRKAPPHWSHLVANHESVVAVAFAAGNFPQLMRSFQVILTQSALADLRPAAGRPSTSDLAGWVEDIAQKKQFPHMLLALGTLRLAKQFDAAAAFVGAQDANIPAAWRAAWENEKAATAWHAGRHTEARQRWDTLEPTVPVLFNRGMAALFAGESSIAKQHLGEALPKLPTLSAWHHLGRLYVTLADLRRS